MDCQIVDNYAEHGVGGVSVDSVIMFLINTCTFGQNIGERKCTSVISGKQCMKSVAQWFLRMMTIRATCSASHASWVAPCVLHIRT